MGQVAERPSKQRFSRAGPRVKDRAKRRRGLVHGVRIGTQPEDVSGEMEGAQPGICEVPGRQLGMDDRHEFILQIIQNERGGGDVLPLAEG
jgi:hypothetical protein